MSGAQTSTDPRFEPRYTMAEAARYLWLNAETLRTWTKGRFYHAAEERRRAAPVLKESAQTRLHFLNLMEAHVLAALRQTHRVPMSRIRRAVTWLKSRYRTEFPLLHPDLQTDGLDLFVQEIGELVSASEQGQAVMRQVLERYLSRIERDSQGMPTLFYPFTRHADAAPTPRLIVINPSVAFGRPVVNGTRVQAAVIAERFAAGDDPNVLAADYALGVEAVYEAIRSHRERAAA